VLSSRPDAPWLPRGGCADVVLAHSDVPPDPVCLARLLVLREGQVLTWPRADGRGPDIPTRAVDDRGVRACVDALVRDVVGPTRPTRLLGYVRNVVRAPVDAYPWPAPQAHFAVWLCELSPGVRAHGVWLDLDDAEPVLGDRHWWPLVDALREGRAHDTD
jgi:hypothetical protein